MRSKLSPPFAFCMETQKVPGRIIVHRIRFDTLALTPAEMENRTFTPLERSNDARTKALRDALTPRTHR
jgi:hypothetical protein